MGSAGIWPAATIVKCGDGGSRILKNDGAAVSLFLAMQALLTALVTVASLILNIDIILHKASL